MQEWNRRQFGMHASSVTYFYFLAIIPIFIFISVLLLFTDIGQNEIIQAIDAVVPDIVSDLLDMVVTEAFQHASALIPLSVVTLLWTSIQGNMALLRGMDSAYNEEETRPYWMRLLISFVWTTVCWSFSPSCFLSSAEKSGSLPRPICLATIFLSGCWTSRPCALSSP